MLALDTDQYLFCQTINQTKDADLKEKCIKMRLQTIVALSHLEALSGLDPDKFKEEIAEWAKIMNRIDELNLEILNPGLVKPLARMGGQPTSHEIQKYLKINPDDLEKAVRMTR
jgi:hypothetical protein